MASPLVRTRRSNRHHGRNTKAAKTNRFTKATLLALGAILVLAQPRGQAVVTATVLPYDRGFVVTGDYVVGGTDLDEDVHPIFSTPDGTFAEIPISMEGVPANADIVGAYLFWETITLNDDVLAREQASGVMFRGEPIELPDPLIAAPGQGAVGRRP